MAGVLRTKASSVSCLIKKSATSPARRKGGPVQVRQEIGKLDTDHRRTLPANADRRDGPGPWVKLYLRANDLRLREQANDPRRHALVGLLRVSAA